MFILFPDEYNFIYAKDIIHIRLHNVKSNKIIKIDNKNKLKQQTKNVNFHQSA